MATIRKLATGKWKAEIVIRQGTGKKPFRRSRTFDRKGQATGWADEAEKKLRAPGGVDRQVAADAQGNPTVGDLVRRYVDENKVPYGRSKADYLRRLQKFPFADRIASELDVFDFYEFGRWLGSGDTEPRAPATVAGLLGTLSVVIQAAEAWGVHIDEGAFLSARRRLTNMGISGKSKVRTRHMTDDEIDSLMQFFLLRYRQSQHRSTIPMYLIFAMAIFSVRRQAEITRLQWSDLDDDRILVRRMKHPRKPGGIDKYVDLTDEARRIIKIHGKRQSDRIFPYSAEVIGDRFREACKVLSIEDLHFHDLRHTGITWLRERGWSTSHVMMVSGHLSTSTLDIYSQLRTRGDRFDNWKWWPEIEANPLKRLNT